MNMADFDFLLNDVNVTLIDSRDILCHNPEHQHAGGTIPAIAVMIGEDKFDIAKDGKTYNISHNEQDGYEGVQLSRAQVLDFIDDCLNAP